MSENIDYLFAREITDDARADILAEKEAEWFGVFKKRMLELGVAKPGIMIIWNKLNCVENFIPLVKTLEILTTGTTEEIASELTGWYYVTGEKAFKGENNDSSITR
tara:strand:- start:520 stop:837 length:318 start_codon:yes stop_codon:yes gene_type:complete